MSALVIKNEPVSGARAVEISVFDPTTGLDIDHDEDITSYLYVRPGTYKYAPAAGTVTNIRRTLTTSSDTIESVDTGLDEVVMTAHSYTNLDGPFDSSEVTGAVAAGDDIWIIVVDANTVAFASSLANAIDGTRIALAGTETGAAITSNASTERGVPGKFLYTFAPAEVAGDVPEISVAILTHATWKGGASVTFDRASSSIWDAAGADGMTRGQELTAAMRVGVAPILKNVLTGEYIVRDALDTKDCYGGTLTASGRVVGYIIDPD